MNTINNHYLPTRPLTPLHTEPPLNTHTYTRTQFITQNNKQNTNWSDLNMNYIFIYKFTMKSASSSLNATELIPSLARSLPLCLNDVATLIHLMKSIASQKSLSSKRHFQTNSPLSNFPHHDDVAVAFSDSLAFCIKCFTGFNSDWH